jgi:hypothetical protein
VFGRRKREEAAAAEAAREADRRALFAKLAERPEHICPFLGLAGERSGYVEGVSDEHRCFAYGDPTPLSAEQKTRVCQERGYGNCPRYLRGVLVIPTEELEALRRPRPAVAEPAPPPPPPPPPRRRRGAPLLVLLGVLVLLVVSAAGAWMVFGPGLTAVAPSPTATATETPAPTPEATAAPTATVEPTAEPTTPPPSVSGPATPTPEPTPEAGDSFAFYEVSVRPANYTLYSLDDDGDVTGTRGASFGGFSYARVEPRDGSDGEVYWETQNGALTGWSYLWPDSGEFRVRAVFLNSAGERRSQYLDEDELTELPEETPAPAP